VIFLFFLTAISINASALTNISDCTTITSPGEYVLTNDIIDSTDTICIDIQASNVTLDCQGHTIDGIDSSDSIGINVNSVNNVSINNCIISDFELGTFVYSSSYNTLSNITTYSNTRHGIHILLSNFSTLSNILSYSNDLVGILYEKSNYSTLSNIITYSNFIGTYLFNNSNYNNVSNVTSYSNQASGFIIGFSSNYNDVSNITTYSNGFGGIVLRSAESNTVSNIITYDNNAGFVFRFANYNNVSNVLSHSNNRSGFYSPSGVVFDNSLFNILSNTESNNNPTGFNIFDSSNNLLENITASFNSDKGILISNSEYITIRNATTYSNYYGTFTNSVNHSIFENIKSTDIFRGIQPEFGTNITIRNSIFDGTLATVSEATGIRPNNITDSLIENNEVFNYKGFPIIFTFGAWTYEAVKNTIWRNNYFHDNDQALEIAEFNNNTTVYNNTFENNAVSIILWGSFNTNVSFNNITNTLAAFFISGAVNSTIHNNTIIADTLSYYSSATEIFPPWSETGIQNLLACNNSAVFNTSWTLSSTGPTPRLFNVMRIESISCNPFLNFIFPSTIDFGLVSPNTIVDKLQSITVESNMVNITYKVIANTDWTSEDNTFSISTLNFTVDKNLPYPTEMITLELGILKPIYHFLVSQFGSMIESLWRLSVPSINPGIYSANITIVAVAGDINVARTATVKFEIPAPTLPFEFTSITGALASTGLFGSLIGIIAVVVLFLIFLYTGFTELKVEELSIRGSLRFIIAFVSFAIVLLVILSAL
jgi:parallel beta-helix repeat protein